MAMFERSIQTPESVVSDHVFAYGLGLGLAYRGFRFQWTRYLNEDDGSMLSISMDVPGVFAVF